MKNKHYYIILLGLMLQTVSLFAQTTSTEKSMFSIHAGPSRYMGKFIGITDYSDDYRDGLRDGFQWDVNYYYLGDRYIFNSCKLAPGLIYQGGRFENSRDDSSDKIKMNYFAPQLGLFMVKQKYNLSLSMGIGYQFYKNKSAVYNKPRNVSMNKAAYNLSAAGEYLLSPKWGVSAKLDWIMSSSDSYSVKYHGQTWQVELPDSSEGGGDYSRLSLVVGLNYHF
ncbi:transporter [uncultured Bacteroides sp.]|uniref:transporter n=1 Tax=uncultured Bacteroides sp. TaxID=162156 RepID=UPI002AA935E7|nr:transporter [uncultured Bacteroides sp.]